MEDQADDQAMMEAMGFASFGMQKPANKKRKYNPHADASFEKTKKAAQSSTGANSTPLGAPTQRQPPAAQPPTNRDEISLDGTEDEDDENENGKGASDTAENGLDAQKGASNTLPKPVAAHLAGLPARPANGAGFSAASQGGIQDSGRPGRGGESHIWYEGYYDHWSNENPWAELEKQHGLKPLGTWPADLKITTT